MSADEGEQTRAVVPLKVQNYLKICVQEPCGAIVVASAIRFNGAHLLQILDSYLLWQKAVERKKLNASSSCHRNNLKLSSYKNTQLPSILYGCVINIVIFYTNSIALYVYNVYYTTWSSCSNSAVVFSSPLKKAFSPRPFQEFLHVK